MAGNQFVGSLISLISKSEIRYEGILYAVDPESHVIGLQSGELAAVCFLWLRKKPSL